MVPSVVLGCLRLEGSYKEYTQGFEEKVLTITM